MLPSYQSIYVKFYRWSYLNFGQGRLPKFKSLFNISFLMTVLLTLGMLSTELIIKFHLITLSYYFALTVLFGETILMVLNYYILLNNRWFERLNDRLFKIGRHNQNKWAMMLMVNIIITCGIFLLTI